MTAVPTAATTTRDPNLRRVAVGSWALYDFANTIWSYAVFSWAVGLYLVGRLGDQAGNSALTLAVAISVLINAAVSPWLGALSDRYGKRLPFLFGFTLLACIPAMAIPFVDVTVGVLLFCVANFGYQAALIYYDATLKLVSRPDNRGWVSGLGTAVGYMGTVLISLTIFLAGLAPETAFVLAPVLFLLFSVPIFLVIREPAGAGTGIR